MVPLQSDEMPCKGTDTQFNGFTIQDVIKNWSLDYKENYVDILNNTEYVNPNIISFALLPTYPTKYMHKAWESKTKTLRDIVITLYFLFYITLYDITCICLSICQFNSLNKH